jgi:hypothetical protein
LETASANLLADMLRYTGVGRRIPVGGPIHPVIFDESIGV